MASYFRNLFGWGSSRPSRSAAQPTPASSSKSHSRSQSGSTAPPLTANYIYASGGSSHVSAMPPSRSVPSKTNSYSLPHTHTATPSPLRYPTTDSRSRPQSRDRERTRPKMGSSASDSKAQASQIYSRQSHRPKDHHVHYPHFVQSGYGTAGSSRSNSSTSIYANMPPSAPLSSSSRHNIIASEPPARRPQLKQNHTWHAGAPGVSVSATSHTSSSHGRASSRSLLQTSAVHMHPLFAYTRLHHAPISYDVTSSPSARTVLDRTTHSPVPAHTLAQPATEPPIPASQTLVLRSDKLPWRVTVGPIGAQPPSGSLGKASGRAISTGTACITNLDVLYALHNELMKRVTTAEWESLGKGSSAQRKVAAAYEKRCTRSGGGWEHGIRRVDWLSSKTRLVGVEVDKSRSAGGCVGTMVFGKA